MPKHLTVDDEGDFITSDVIGAANGVAQLGSDGKVPDSQLPTVLTGAVDSVNGQIGNVMLTADSVGALDTAARGAVNGVASLDATARILASQLPTTALQSGSLGIANGIATLDSGGKLTASQVPTAPVTSVAGRTGAVVVTSTDVGAIPTTQKAAANGVASLDGTTKIPSAQIPSLAGSYLVVPGATPTKAGQQYTAVAGGSNGGQWSDPLVYKASSAGAMPTGVPDGSLCTRTDLSAVYQYLSGTWVSMPYIEPWRTITLASGVRGYQANASTWLPRVRRIGSQVHMQGRVELVSGLTWNTNYVLFDIPSDCLTSRSIDLTGTSTTASGQIGTCRYQLDSGTQQLILFAGSGPNPSTPWLGFNFSYWMD